MTQCAAAPPETPPSFTCVRPASSQTFFDELPRECGRVLNASSKTCDLHLGQDVSSLTTAVEPETTCSHLKHTAACTFSSCSFEKKISTCCSIPGGS
ncbi:hypothetical protein OJAV_G00209760 [Oryzias javanicus]|uniref:Uncharacterized protein n=1 Tax=Oryzias javanicus TaxID=123683 RepID=A0A437C6Z5_ORYJA|nr:hypothetical protein OJAV_G00209760 [Oryzias javanicus]